MAKRKVVRKPPNGVVRRLSVKAFFLEAVVQRCSVKKVFSEISENSKEDDCARVSLFQ